MPSKSRRAGARDTAQGPPHVAAMPRAAWAGWVALATAFAGFAVFRGALGLFFAQDDFAGLARAAGVLPRLSGPWRYLSGQLYFDVMRRGAGLHAWPYHAVSLAAHLACGVLLAQLLTRRFSRTAAAFGAIAFVTHPAPFTAIYSVSGIGELLAALFTLAALRLSQAPRPAGNAAPVAFGLSLLCKESTILLPAVAACGFAGAPRERADRRWLVVGGGLIATAYIVFFVGADVFQVRSQLPGSAAYALAGPADLGRNLLTYLGWTANLFLPTVRGVGDAVDPAVFAWGVALAVLWVAGLASAPLRARGWAAAGAAYVMFLLPVLPLKNHTYHYYLYLPLTAAAWCAAAAADALLASARGARIPALLVGLAAILLTVNGALLVRRIETTPFIHPDMRADASVDRSRIARNVRDGLAAASLQPGERLVFWSPELASARSDLARAAAERYWTSNLRAALLDGVGVRVMFTQVAGVEFVETPGWRDGDRIAIYQRSGVLSVKTAAEVDSLLKSHPIE